VAGKTAGKPSGKSDGRSRKRSAPLTGGRRKSCFFCKSKVDEIDYKNIGELRRYISEKGKIRSRRISGACRRHQRQVAVAIKRAREMALLPYVAEGREERSGGRGDRGDRGDRGER
jgi:small subunit ribosomal protein S18